MESNKEIVSADYYVDTPERRTLNLEPEGLPCIPVLGCSHYKKARKSTTEHVHPGCLEVSFCQRGSLVFESAGHTFDFLPGKIFVSQPDEWHRLRTNPKGLVMYWLFFRFPAEGGCLLGLPPDESRWLDQALRSFAHRLFDGTARVRQAFQRFFMFYDTLPAGTAHRRLELKNTAMELLLALIEASEIQSRESHADRIEPLLMEMQAHPELPFHIDDLARKCSLSASALTTLFKQTTGLPPHAFLLGCRIKRAKEMLDITGTSILQISSKLGFSSSQHFATHFKKETGLTPSEFRRERHS
ncbi:MAG: AraC family transcriptional regulator [Kiritimatiellae bacterium]|jgi:AraC-like DNA-binding protein|nr:AraC family transcriptional regulator [Kiritimatiellia bacterium]